MSTAIIIGLAAALLVSNAVTWAVTRLRNGCDHYTPRHADVPEGAKAKVTSGEIPADYDPPSASMNPAAVTSPDIRWQVAP